MASSQAGPEQAVTGGSGLPLWMLATGTFAIGTEGFMIAPLLPTMAHTLDRSVVQAGQLVTGFTLAYAFSAPVLTALSTRLERRRLLLASLAVFFVGNLLCAWAGDFLTLLLARVLMGTAAGLFMPNANAVASGLVESARRGRALALVAGGQSLAIALGVPLAAVLGAHLGWRATFVGVAVLTLVAMIGIRVGMPLRPATATQLPWAARFLPLRQRSVVVGLAVTLGWAAGAYTMLTYLAAYLAHTVRVQGAGIGAYMAVWGAAAAAGVLVGGRASDRFGAGRSLRLALALLVLAFLGMWAVGQGGAIAAAPRAALVVACLIAWGLAVWGFFPAQQMRLVNLAGPDVAPLVLSLNSSVMYLGFAVGSALGAAVLKAADPPALGLAAGLCVLIALGIAVGGHR